MMTKTNMMKSVMMLLAIAGSNYSYAQQATVVVSNTTAAQRMELIEVSMADVKAKLSNATPGKGQAYVVKNPADSKSVHRLPTMVSCSSMPVCALIAQLPFISA